MADTENPQGKKKYKHSYGIICKAPELWRRLHEYLLQRLKYPVPVGCRPVNFSASRTGTEAGLAFIDIFRHRVPDPFLIGLCKQKVAFDTALYQSEGLFKFLDKLLCAFENAFHNLYAVQISSIVSGDMQFVIKVIKFLNKLTVMC